MAGYSHQKKSNGFVRRWSAAAGLLLFFLALFLWLNSAAAEKEADVRTMPELSAEFDPNVTETPEQQVMSTPEPRKLPAGTGHYEALSRPDGYKITPKEDACWPGMSDLAADAKKHQCRFMSGSGQLFPDYEYGMPVPESEAVEDTFFSDSVFIGNSLEQGFMLYAGLKTADIFATQSINVTNIYFTKVVQSGDERLTLLEAMAQKQYSRVYIMLGINEMSYATTESFYEGYAQLIDDIRELEPTADILLQSITPVSAAKSASSSTFNNERIHVFNDVIRQLAADKEAHYLYVYDSLADEDGCLPAGSSEDGIHPYGKYYPKWLTYLKSHTIAEVVR